MKIVRQKADSVSAPECNFPVADGVVVRVRIESVGAATFDQLPHFQLCGFDAHIMPDNFSCAIIEVVVCCRFQIGIECDADGDECVHVVSFLSVPSWDTIIIS